MGRKKPRDLSVVAKSPARLRFGSLRYLSHGKTLAFPSIARVRVLRKRLFAKLCIFVLSWLCISSSEFALGFCKRSNLDLRKTNIVPKTTGANELPKINRPRFNLYSIIHIPIY